MTIYYQADWLVWGGPPPRSDSPEPTPITENNAGMLLSLVVKPDNKIWQIICGDGNISDRWVVAESTDVFEITQYFVKLMLQWGQWVAENAEEANR